MPNKTVMRALVGLGLIAAAGGDLSATTVALKQGDEARWRREVLPLPHELAIKQVQRLTPGELLVKGRPGAFGLEQTAVSNVVALFKEKTGVVPQGKGFQILIGLIDDKGKLGGIDVPNAARLKEVPNRDQAYVIQPVGEKMLIVAAVSPRGLYYGTRTLSQWLEYHLSREMAEIPLASVVDWPDLEERGFWHMPAYLVPWLASMKINRFYLGSAFAIQSNGAFTLQLYHTRKDYKDEVCHEKARLYAAEIVPGPMHMDFWEASFSGFKEAYPGLIGKGESAKNPASFEAGGKQRVLCATNPDLVKILTVVMTNHAAQGASEVMVWMSEYAGAQCACATCVKEGQYRAEVRAALEAWKVAKKTYPDLRLSVFFGRGGVASSRYPWPDRYPDQEIKDIVASLPPEVTMRASMGCNGPDGRLLADFAAKGKRISQMDASYLSESFMSDDVRVGIERIVSAKYIGAWTFTPGVYANTDNNKKMYNYRASALAEYEWNAKGRSAQEFAEAWAVRQGYKDPVKFVTWVGAMNMPNQAGRLRACWPKCGDSWFKNLTNMVAQKKWDETQFKPGEPEAGIKQSGQALALAEGLGGQDLIQNSRLMLAYCRLEQAGYRFISKLQDTTIGGAAKEKAVGDAFAQLKEALKKYVQVRLNGTTSDIAKEQGAELEGELDKVSVALSVKK